MRLQKKKQGCRDGATRSKNEAQRGKQAREKRGREVEEVKKETWDDVGYLEERASWKKWKPEERKRVYVLVNHEVAYLTKNKTT